MYLIFKFFSLVKLSQFQIFHLQTSIFLVQAFVWNFGSGPDLFDSRSVIFQRTLTSTAMPPKSRNKNSSKPCRYGNSERIPLTYSSSSITTRTLLSDGSLDDDDVDGSPLRRLLQRQSEGSRSVQRKQATAPEVK